MLDSIFQSLDLFLKSAWSRAARCGNVWKQTEHKNGLFSNDWNTSSHENKRQLRNGGLI